MQVLCGGVRIFVAKNLLDQVDWVPGVEELGCGEVANSVVAEVFDPGVFAGFTEEAGSIDERFAVAP